MSCKPSTRSPVRSAPSATGLRIGARWSYGLRLAFLKLRVGVEDQLSDAVLSGAVDDGPEQGKASALAVDAVLTGGKCDVATETASAFPDTEADKLETREWTIGEVD